MLIIDQKSRDFEFTFDSGEHKGESYIGSIKFCPTPTCTCKDGSITLKSHPVNREEGRTSESPQYSFAINIEKKTVSNRDDMEVADKNTAKSFINNITKGEWEKLFLNYLWFKTYVTENTDAKEIAAVFPDELISGGATVNYGEILPFCEKIYVTIDGEEYLVTDRYCVQPHCKCKEVFLGFCALTKNSVPLKRIKEDIVLMCHYKKENWELYGNSQKKYDIKLFPDLCMQALKERRSDIFSILGERHDKLKTLYKQYLKDHKHNEIDPLTLVSEKISRNSNCPCGSGKKYKRCCMNK